MEKKRLNKNDLKKISGNNEKPDITREENLVIIDCHNEEAAINFEKGIRSAFASPMISKMLLKASKKNRFG